MTTCAWLQGLKKMFYRMGVNLLIPLQLAHFTDTRASLGPALESQFLVVFLRRL
jgi:hypothetical protein